MANYKLLSGVFEGSVVEEGVEILDVGFYDLDDETQYLIREWAEQQLGRKYVEVDGGIDFAYKGADTPISLNQIKKDYEQSWDKQETEEVVDLRPMSEQIPYFEWRF